MFLLAQENPGIACVLKVSDVFSRKLILMLLLYDTFNNIQHFRVNSEVKEYILKMEHKKLCSKYKRYSFSDLQKWCTLLLEIHLLLFL